MNKLIIELGGKERTLRFNMLFLEEMAKLVERHPIEEDGLKDLKGTAVFIYAGIKSDAILNDKELDVSYADCWDWTEEMILNNESEKIVKILKAYEDSTAYKSAQDIKKKMGMEQQIGTLINDTHLVNSE